MLFDQNRPRLGVPELPSLTRLIPLERHLSAVRWQFIRGVLLGILVSSAVAIPAFKYSNVRQQGASLQPGGRQRVLGNPEAQTASPAGKSTSETEGAFFRSPIPPKPQSSKALNHTRYNPVEPAWAKDRANSPASFAVSQPVASTSLSFAEPRPTKQTLATLAKLWASVEAGDTKAAVILADLYLRGEGVPVNCEQARVLLFVASKENNAEAAKKLQGLEETGCPAP
jgi:hypothetical protein